MFEIKFSIKRALYNNLNMNFKERFAGKTSKITRDGDLEGKAAEFDEPKKGPIIPSRGNSISKKDKIQDNDHLNVSNSNITRNSRLSYKASESSNMKKTQEINKSFVS